MQGEMEQKRGDERKQPWGAEEMRGRRTAKKWRSQQIEIMMREWVARDLELLVRRAEEEETRWRIFVLFTYWDPGCMITIPLQSHRLSLPPSIVPVSLPLLVSPLSVSVFSFLSLCPPPSYATLCHFTTWWAWHLVRFLNPSGLGSGFIPDYTLQQYVGFNKGNILLQNLT